MSGRHLSEKRVLGEYHEQCCSINDTFTENTTPYLDSAIEDVENVENYNNIIKKELQASEDISRDIFLQARRLQNIDIQTETDVYHEYERQKENTGNLEMECWIQQEIEAERMQFVAMIEKELAQQKENFLKWIRQHQFLKEDRENLKKENNMLTTKVKELSQELDDVRNELKILKQKSVDLREEERIEISQ